MVTFLYSTWICLRKQEVGKITVYHPNSLYSTTGGTYIYKKSHHQQTNTWRLGLFLTVSANKVSPPLRTTLVSNQVSSGRPTKTSQNSPQRCDPSTPGRHLVWTDHRVKHPQKLQNTESHQTLKWNWTISKHVKTKANQQKTTRFWRGPRLQAISVHHVPQAGRVIIRGGDQQFTVWREGHLG